MDMYTNYVKVHDKLQFKATKQHGQHNKETMAKVVSRYHPNYNCIEQTKTHVQA